MLNFPFKYIINLLLFILLTIFFIFSLNIYLNNDHVVSKIVKNNVSIIQISIASSRSDLVKSLDGLVSQTTLRNLFYNKFDMKSFVMEGMEEAITQFNEIYFYNINVLAKVSSLENKTFYEKFKNEKQNTKKILSEIFLNQIQTLDKLDKLVIKEKGLNVFSKEDMQAFNQFKGVIDSPLFRDCKSFRVSADIIVSNSYQTGQSDNFDTGYKIYCLGEKNYTSKDNFKIDISIFPYYEDTYSEYSLNFVYIIYVFLSFIFAVILIFLNLKSIKLTINSNLKN